MANILIVTWNFPPTTGGIENLIGDIYINLSKYHDVSVITAGKPDEESDSNVIRLRARNVSIFLIKAFFLTLKVHLERKFDLLLSGSLLINPITVFVGMLTRTPRITMSYGLDIIYPNPFYQFVMRTTINRNNAVAVISENSRKLAIKHGLAPQKAVMLHPGVPDKLLQGLESSQDPASVRDKYGIGDRPCIVSVGRLTKRKGILPFVRECFPRILESIPECVLLIVGEDPTEALVHKEGELAQIKDAVKKLGIDENVIFAGHVDDGQLMNVYVSADLFVFPVIEIPNDIEGFGMVAIEAALVEKPAVATEVGGIPDAVENGVSGILVKPGDYEAFAEAVIDLLTDDDRRISLGRSARERVLDRFTWNTLIQKWNSMIETILFRD